jgi:RNA polymerase sigma-70 factor (ECF subfamily)
MPRSRNPPPLCLVTTAAGAPAEAATGTDASHDGARTRELDWSMLMARAQNGDAEAYRRLLAAIAPYVRSLAARHHRDAADIEDTVQDVLLTVHAVRQTYDPSRPFGPWLVAIAHRRIIDRLRRQGRRRAREVPLEPSHETFSAVDANLPESSALTETLDAAIARLPLRQREAIRLTKLREMPLKQAAAVTGASTAALKVSVHRAMKTLRKLLAAEDR